MELELSDRYFVGKSGLGFKEYLDLDRFIRIDGCGDIGMFIEFNKHIIYIDNH